MCAIRQTVDLSGRNNTTLTPIDIAGTYKTSNGRSIDAKYELLHNSNSNSDVGREGVRVELHGGRFPYDDTKAGIDQRAIIEFVCDKDRTGLEGDAGGDGGKAKDPSDEDGDKDDDKDGDSDDSKDGEDDGNDNDDEKRKLKSRDDASSGKCDESDASLRFCGYGLEDLAKNKKARTLRLEWRTKYACRDAPADNGGSSWGFFTWFIIMYVITPTIASAFHGTCKMRRVHPKLLILDSCGHHCGHSMTTVMLTITSEFSSLLLPTSFSAHGSTTTGTVPAVGISSLTAIRSAISRTSSRTWAGGWPTQYKVPAVGVAIPPCEMQGVVELV